MNNFQEEDEAVFEVDLPLDGAREWWALGLVRIKTIWLGVPLEDGG